ncbi:MAG TPA: hypothetical protein VGO90_08320 [Chthoniobacteraceae bacterium]|jgi:uncharacterized membrane protein|nr:putative rane protein [Chthoniobacter sp.]HEV7867672.1 hypothetical protein [Chthoniobacteraceae bacterium]
MSENPYSPPPVSTDPPAADTLTTVAGGLAPNIAAGIACLFSLPGGVLFLVIEKKNQFVRMWAMQAVVLGAAGFAFWILSQMLLLVFRQIPLLGAVLTFVLSGIALVFWLGWLVGYVITIVKAFAAEQWELPVLGALARLQLAHMDGNSTTPPVPPGPPIV